MAKRRRHRREAVALTYRAPRDKAPRVKAKGKGMMAEKILALAREHGIPVREDPDLVQVLSALDLEQEIPPTLYAAVAEILAFVYRLNEKAASSQGS